MLCSKRRLVAAALLVLFGTYFCADALCVSGSMIEAGLLFFGGLSSAATLLLTESWGHLFDFDAPRVGAIVVLFLSLFGIALNNPLTDDCRQNAYKAVLESISPDQLATIVKEMTSEDNKLAIDTSWLRTFA